MENRTIEQVRKNETKLINEIKDLEQQVKKQKEVINKIFSRITLWKMEDITMESAKVLDDLLDILKGDSNG